MPQPVPKSQHMSYRFGDAKSASSSASVPKVCSFETMEAMKEYKIEPKALRLVAASPEKAPWLCLVEGRLGGKTGITVKNNLFIYKSKDVLSDEMTRILGKYREDM